jgi:hypothetical protein
MSDEFDDLPEPAARRDRSKRGLQGDGLSRVPQLIAEVYGAAAAPLRARLLECLLQPVGPLGLVAIAAGTFSGFLHRARSGGPKVSLADAASISGDQMFELARYVEQSSPDTFQQIASLLAERPVGVASVSASVLLLTLHVWRRRRHGRSR